MHDVLRVQDLIRELEALPLDAPVMVAVVKYPDQFELKSDWDLSSAVEVCPLETGEVLDMRGMVLLTVELTDFQEELEAHIPGNSSHS